MVGLPIGPKEVSCVKVGGGTGAQTYRMAAESFISSNCVGCPFHAEVAKPNFGREVVDRLQEQKRERETAEQERNRFREFIVEGVDVEAVLEGDVDSDPKLKTLVSQLVDPANQKKAAQTLESVARDFPGLFTRDVLEVISGAFSEMSTASRAIQGKKNS